MKRLDGLNDPHCKIELFASSLSIKAHPKLIIFEKQNHLIETYVAKVCWFN